MTLKNEFSLEKFRVSELLQSNYAVPNFQREYSWKAENVQDLLDDISALIYNQSDTYYLGQIVVTKSNVINGVQRAYVVDGQQRLVTLLLLSIALFKQLKKDLNDKISIELGDNYKNMVREVESSTGDLIMRVLLPKSDHLFHYLINNNDLPSKKVAAGISEENIINAYSTIQEFLNNLKVADLKKFQAGLRDRTYLSKLTIGTIGEALEIFEVLNQRGLELNDSDLMKNLLFRESSESEYDKISKTWDDVSKKVYELTPKRLASINLLLRAELTARTKQKVSTNDLLDGWRLYLLGDDERGVESRLDPHAFIKELPKIGAAYCELCKLEKLNKEPFKSGRGLKHFNSVQHIAVLLGGRKLKNIEVLLEIIEQRVLLSLYANEGPQNFEKIIPDWANAIYELGEENPDAGESEIEKASTKALSGLKDLWDQFETMFNSLQYSKDSKKIRFAVARVHAKLEGDCFGNPDYQALLKTKIYHLDHIEPQNSNQKNIFQVEGLNLIDSIGNLAFIEPNDNSGLKDKKPEERIDYYRKTNWVNNMILCPAEVLNVLPKNRKEKFQEIQASCDLSLKNWTPNSVQRRTVLYMNEFAKTFTRMSPPEFELKEADDGK
jgi:hypothetical protein